MFRRVLWSLTIFALGCTGAPPRGASPTAAAAEVQAHVVESLFGFHVILRSR